MDSILPSYMLAGHLFRRAEEDFMVVGIMHGIIKKFTVIHFSDSWRQLAVPMTANCHNRNPNLEQGTIASILVLSRPFTRFSFNGICCSSYNHFSFLLYFFFLYAIMVSPFF